MLHASFAVYTTARSVSWYATMCHPCRAPLRTIDTSSSFFSVARLHNRDWTAVAFHSSSPRCVEILDWPQRAFTTMDGARGGDTPDKSRYCNVFDRLPSFALRYSTMSPEVLSKNTNAPSTAPGGA